MFIISGYLFFLKFERSISGFTNQYRKRFRSLVVPYFLWSTWSLLYFFILQLFPQARPFFYNDLVVNYSFATFFDKIVIHPHAYQLWYVRDLIMIVAFSPLIYGVIKYLKVLSIIVLFIFWVLFENIFGFAEQSYLIFFGVGAFISIQKKSYLLTVFHQKLGWLFLIIFILTTFLKTILVVQNSPQPLLRIFLDNLSHLSGIIAVWCLYDTIIVLIKQKFFNKIMYGSSICFFIYAFHEPILITIKKGLFYFLEPVKFGSMVVYIVAPTVTIILSIVCGHLTKKYFPKFYSVITGGR